MIGRLTARKSARRSRRSNTKVRARGTLRTEPYALSSVMASGPSDPPQISTNVVGNKVVRMVITPEPSVGSKFVLAKDILFCLPVLNPDCRILKMSAWGEDHDYISCVFPVGGTDNGIGDDAAWSDRGVPGQSLAQMHVTPSFNFRNRWFSLKGETRVATFSTTQKPDKTYKSVIVDFTLQYRTALQRCPAYLYLESVREEEEQLLHA